MAGQSPIEEAVKKMLAVAPGMSEEAARQEVIDMLLGMSGGERYSDSVPRPAWRQRLDQMGVLPGVVTGAIGRKQPPATYQGAIEQAIQDRASDRAASAALRKRM